MSPNEEFVRKHWNRAECEWRYIERGTPKFALKHEQKRCGWIIRIKDVVFIRSGAKTQEEAWSLAAEFTRERLKQIAEIEEELRSVAKWIKECIYDGLRLAVRERIQTRLQRELSTLRQGMREAPKPEVPHE